MDLSAITSTPHMTIEATNDKQRCFRNQLIFIFKRVPDYDVYTEDNKRKQKHIVGYKRA